MACPRRRSGVAPDSDLRNEKYGDRRDACPTQTVIVPPEEVREQFQHVKPLKKLSVKERGWTLNVLNGVRSLGKRAFTNGDAYTLAEQLEQLHPDNRSLRTATR